MAFKGYLNISGNPFFQTDINPSVLYTNNGNYLRVDYSWDIVGRSQPVWAGQSTNWFTYENYVYGNYWNIGNITGINSGIYNQDSNPYFIVDNGTASFYANGALIETKTFGGTLGYDNLRFWPGYGDATVHTRFYGFKLSDRGGNVLANIVADPQGIKDEVSGKVYNMTGSGSFEYVSLHIFNPDINKVRFDQTGGTATVNVEAETTWEY